ncbi:MAG TPA: hypothetical protein VF070_14045 [Streptosporangiaceae bacterium]
MTGPTAQSAPDGSIIDVPIPAGSGWPCHEPEPALSREPRRLVR